MKYEIIPGGEYEWFYSTDGEYAKMKIGHVRCDFGSGNEFYHTWWPGSLEDEYNTPDFRAELNALFTDLREGILKSAQMAAKEAAMMKLPHIENDDRYCHFHVLTPEHEYYIRLFPGKGDYCYCYQWQEFHMKFAAMIKDDMRNRNHEDLSFRRANRIRFSGASLFSFLRLFRISRAFRSASVGSIYSFLSPDLSILLFLAFWNRNTNRIFNPNPADYPMRRTSDTISPHLRRMPCQALATARN